MAACLYLFSSQYFIMQPFNDVARQIWRTRGLIVSAPSRDGKSFVSYSLISRAFLHFCVSGELFQVLSSLAPSLSAHSAKYHQLVGSSTIIHLHCSES
jgi:hypothetical protein